MVVGYTHLNAAVCSSLRPSSFSSRQIQFVEPAQRREAKEGRTNGIEQKVPPYCKITKNVTFSNFQL